VLGNLLSKAGYLQKEHMINEHNSEWMGYPVKPFVPEETVSDYKNTLYRIGVNWDDNRSLVDLLACFLENPASVDTPGIILGSFGESDTDPTPAVEALVAARSRLPHLKGLFIGDIISEENEISWIQQTDLSALFGAFPALEYFRARGGNGLVLGRISHGNLRSLTIESGGLPRGVIRDVLASSLPALEHLEIWPGTEDYGWDGSLEDFRPLFEAPLFPNLRYLGLRNSTISDELAAAFGSAAVFENLHILDLSLGTLSDEGAARLLESPTVKLLKGLDLHHHYLSEGMMAKILESFPFANVDDVETPDDWDGESHRYVAVSE